jgi:hypothetical protein
MDRIFRNRYCELCNKNHRPGSRLYRQHGRYMREWGFYKGRAIKAGTKVKGRR